MNYDEVLEYLKKGYSAKLPHWEKDYFIYMETSVFSLIFNQEIESFIALNDNGIIKPYVPLELEKILTSWEVEHLYTIEGEEIE